MSEYTKYFVVKAASEDEVHTKLENAKIRSIVDADLQGLGFAEDYTRDEVNWVVVSAPGESRFEDGQFDYSDQFDKLKKLFPCFILFFEEENGIDWMLSIHYKGQVIEKLFYMDRDFEFTEEERHFFEKVFDAEFDLLEPNLLPNGGLDFLNMVGIPYFQRNDQDDIPMDMFDDLGFSLLVDQISD